MNIGFFGDSYVDLNLDFHAARAQEDPPDVSRKSLSWCWRLCNDLEYAPVNSGLGGSNQFYSIESWQEFIASGRTTDYAIFTFTWEDRLYARGSRHDVLRSMNQNTEDIKKRLCAIQNDTNLDIDELVLAGRLYHKLLHDDNQAKFIHTLMIKWILDLPTQHPNTKFIFLPNTELSRNIALEHFKKGVLLDFTFEKISLIEGERVGIDPFVDPLLVKWPHFISNEGDYLNADPHADPFSETKFGHMTDVNHDRFKDLIKNIILSYNTHEDKVYPIDYEQFRID